MQNFTLTAPVIVASREKTVQNSSVAIFNNSLTRVPISRGNRRFWIDGSGIFKNECIRRDKDLDNILPAESSDWPLEKIANWWAEGVRNPCALYVEDQSESWAACLPDPLGGAVALYYKHENNKFISTSNVEIFKTASKFNINLEKDPLFQIERLLLGNGGLTPSSFKDVKSVEPFQYLVLKNDQISVKNYTVMNDLSSMSLHEVFVRLRKDVLDNVRAISYSGAGQIVSHITGGFDSRLVLSAILNLGIQDKVDLFCSGPEGSTDRVVADGLTREYSLRRTNGAGLTTAPTTNMSERLMGALFASGGITNTGPHGRELHADVAAMGGGYGEVLRTFYGTRNLRVDGKLNKDMLTSSFMPAAATTTSYISKLASSEISTKLYSRFSNLDDQYQGTDFVADAFYSHVRNRYHIGQTSLLWSRVGSRFDPLYSIAGFEYSRRTTQQSRSSNIVGFDLMDSLFQDLLRRPFDYDRFNDQLRAFRKTPSQTPWLKDSSTIQFRDAIKPTTSDSSPFLETLSKLNATEPQMTAASRREMTQIANKMGVSFWQIVYKQTGQQLLEHAYEQTRGEHILDVIDPKYIETLIVSKSMTKKQLRDLYSLGGILLWHSFG